MDYLEFHSEFQRQVRVLPHRKLKDLAIELREITHRRYVGGKKAKNEHVEHGFTMEEFRMFLGNVEDGEFRTVFTLIGVLGRRPNELVRLRGRDLVDGKLILPASKGGLELDARLPPSLLSLIPPAGPDERIFFREFTVKTALRKLGQAFRAARARAGMDEIYGWSAPCGRTKRQIRPLTRFSIKSLRHTGSQAMTEITGDTDLSRRLLGHRSIKTTLTYSRKERKAQLERGIALTWEAINPAVMRNEVYLRPFEKSA